VKTKNIEIHLLLLFSKTVMQKVALSLNRIFYFISLFFAAQSVCAQLPQIHLAPVPSWISRVKDFDKKPSLRSVRDGYFYDLSEQQINIEKKSEYFHYTREIVSSTGIQNGSQISVGFDPAYERVDFHRIIVWRNNQPQDRLKLSAFKILADEQDFSKFIYQGSYSANLILDDIRKGDKIEYSFTITGRNPIFGDKFSQEVYLQSGKPLAHQYVSLLASQSRKLNIKLFNKASKPVTTNENGLTRYAWEDFLVEPAIDNDNEPSWYNSYNYVEVSDYSSWAEVANWALGINQPSSAVKGNLAQLVADLKAKSGNDKTAYFRSAVRVVQDEVRYMGIEIGEYSHRANRPEKVYDQRYGDCKDKSLLLASILRAGGIDASMVLVNADLDDKIDQFDPTPNAFNHAVVVAEVNGKQVWVDATISNQGGDGTDIYFPDYGKGLILKPGNNSLTTIPVSKTGKEVCEEKFIGSNNDKAKVALDVRTTYTLDQADRQRDKLESTGIAATEKDYLDYYSKIYSKIESRDSLQVIDDIHKNTLTTIEHYLISDFYKRDSISGRASAYFYANYISHELPAISNQAKAPVAVEYPFDMDYTVKMYLPGGWNINDDHNSINRDAYKFSSHYSTDGDTLLLHYSFAYLQDHVAADKVDQFKKDISDLKDGGGLAYNIDYPMSNPPFVLNTWLAVFALAIIGLVTYIGIRIYHTETPGIVFASGSSFVPIGGWLILVLIGLVLTPIGVGAQLYTGHYFGISKWNTYMSGGTSIAYRILLVYETIGYVVIAAYSVFCFILLIRRRDILPKFIIGYYIFAAAFFVIDCLFAAGIGIGSDSRGTALFRALLIAGIWVSYFKRSTRVEETFIVPYPPDNYSHEEVASN
jgi:transglutaminase-like putative cysteine protease